MHFTKANLKGVSSVLFIYITESFMGNCNCFFLVHKLVFSPARNENIFLQQYYTMPNFKAHCPDLQEVILDFIPLSRKWWFHNVHNTHTPQ